mmetsp:Transcript_36636/g.77876  ORF Transcript_36636/g.77876 Transcript_36636/m.77876 type:complete len:210 (+) Transcript_36636:50-679(+)
MAWIGGRKGRMGGNPGSVSKMSGDLPASIDATTNRSANMDLTAVLMGRGAKAVGGHAGTPRHMQGAQVATDVKIPEWIEPGAHICYLSRSTGQRLEVVVEMVNQQKAEVEISAVEGGGWRVIPFAIIGSAHNPLFPASALPQVEVQHDVGPVAAASAGASNQGAAEAPAAGAAETVDLDDEEVEVTGEKKSSVVDLEDRERSRSPRKKK